MSSAIPIARRARRTFGNLMTGFGMSEVGIGVTFSFLDSTEEQCVEANGYPAPGYEVRIVDPRPAPTSRCPCPARSSCASYTVTRGYYKKPEETARAIDAEGWFHTGDMGVCAPTATCGSWAATRTCSRSAGRTSTRWRSRRS